VDDSEVGVGSVVLEVGVGWGVWVRPGVWVGGGVFV
jgi:hypothetical protein